MAVTAFTYVRKDPSIQLVKFDTSSVEAMQEVYDWVADEIDDQDCIINLQTGMGGMLRWSLDEIHWTVVRPNEYIAKDSNGKLFKMSQELVDAFYDPAP